MIHASLWPRREFPFEQLPAALTYLKAGRARGKVVLRLK
ncbi:MULTISPECIES: zinc-binding dehydrogenase [unclassified Bradyrhizobium]|nr:zinc-binding dehydrogenase [Bradyrhizobium sp. 157]